jgi:regulator of cell morphogenesis and NO signaling
MTVDTNVTVADLAAGSLGAVRVFERLGIDYCCGGKRPLAEVCAEKGLEPEAVQRELNAGNSSSSGDRDWNSAPLLDLVSHIVNTHHGYLRRELAPLQARLEKVYRVYNERYGPTLTGLPQEFERLRAELELHTTKEERILFPAIVAAEAAVHAWAPPPANPFGSIRNPIRMMESEHEGTGRGLEEIRRITNNFEIPEYACNTFRALMSGLQELEQDLHLHIHLENNILFPRAIELERKRQ